MKVELKRISGNWTDGYALDKHMLSSEFLGNNEFGYPQFNNVRTEVGESVYQLKYRRDWNQVGPLADAVVQNIVPRLGSIGLVLPVPASQYRDRQPVYEVASKIADLMGVPYFTGIVRKLPTEGHAVSLKDIHLKADKVAALSGRLTLHDEIGNEGCWNALVVDDLYDSGATLEAVCDTLRTYRKVKDIFVSTLTWK